MINRISNKTVCFKSSSQNSTSVVKQKNYTLQEKKEITDGTILGALLGSIGGFALVKFPDRLERIEEHVNPQSKLEPKTRTIAALVSGLLLGTICSFAFRYQQKQDIKNRSENKTIQNNL